MVRRNCASQIIPAVRYLSSAGFLKLLSCTTKFYYEWQNAVLPVHKCSGTHKGNALQNLVAVEKTLPNRMKSL